MLRRSICLSFSLFVLACVGDPVGDPCLPEQVPEDARSGETFVEDGSPQCATRVCIARGLMGDPTPGCTEGCASDADVRDHVYCTCRCDGPDACACPDGFVCEDTGALGHFCVRELP
ncbi:MAG TPA: hypothetical protein RMH99_08285 [Sandaracinaceae bacterium LLY-WYZ-13_1]|nr:hypothetical protein [Sandaracinaceae bacterium LLY-WYZ-13_1]